MAVLRVLGFQFSCKACGYFGPVHSTKKSAFLEQSWHTCIAAKRDDAR